MEKTMVPPSPAVRLLPLGGGAASTAGETSCEGAQSEYQPLFSKKDTFAVYATTDGKYDIPGSHRFWQSAPGDARPQEFVIDFGGERKVASVEIEWEVC